MNSNPLISCETIGCPGTQAGFCSQKRQDTIRERRNMDNIEKDVAAALRLGYGTHYGRYKVDYPHTADHSVVEEPEQTKTCKMCGMEFILTRQDQKYCSEECRVKWNSQRKKPQKKGPYLECGPAQCPICGKKFVRTTDDRRKVFCGRSCSAKSREARRKRETSSEGES